MLSGNLVAEKPESKFLNLLINQKRTQKPLAVSGLGTGQSCQVLDIEGSVDFSLNPDVSRKGRWLEGWVPGGAGGGPELELIYPAVPQERGCITG